MKFLAKTLHGLEEILAQEIKDLGGTNVQLRARAVEFQGDLEILYKCSIGLRTCVNILTPVFVCKVKNERDLYNKLKTVWWNKYMSLNNTFSVDSTIKSPYFNHSKYVALKTKDAIVDYFRDKTGRRPDIDTKKPDIKINVHINNDTCTVSLDSSGIPLYKRGYRLNKAKAPLNEALASGMILLSGWNKKDTFIDPMCGSGTLLTEAALIAINRAPNIKRDYFAFKQWKDFDKDLFIKVRKELQAQELTECPEIIGNDRAELVIDQAKSNIENAELTPYIHISNRPFEHFTPMFEKAITIINPPYGERLGTKERTNDLYKLIGDTLKQTYTNATCWIISSNKEALKHIGLRSNKKHTLFNGQLECKYQKYELYSGSKKTKKQDTPNK